MTKAQKKFILKKLIPFILREQGRGFDMWQWLRTGLTPGFEYGGESWKVPKCGTIGCIGGSIQYLKGLEGIYSYEEMGALIGLNMEQSDCLFDMPMKWPKPYYSDYYYAKTPLLKAKVAVKLLKLVVKTEGKCLDAAN